MPYPRHRGLSKKKFECHQNEVIETPEAKDHKPHDFDVCDGETVRI